MQFGKAINRVLNITRMFIKKKTFDSKPFKGASVNWGPRLQSSNQNFHIATAIDHKWRTHTIDDFFRLSNICFFCAFVTTICCPFCTESSLQLGSFSPTIYARPLRQKEQTLNLSTKQVSRETSVQKSRALNVGEIDTRWKSMIRLT